jgi:hypothetical protein
MTTYQMNLILAGSIRWTVPWTPDSLAVSDIKQQFTIKGQYGRKISFLKNLLFKTSTKAHKQFLPNTTPHCTITSKIAQ